MSPRKSYVRKRYWNKPEMGWWERAYFFEVVRGLGSPAACSSPTCGSG